jgi:hypothetical protein
MMFEKTLVVAAALALAGTVACTANTTNTTTSPATKDGGGVSTKEKPTTKPKTASLKTKAGSTPPAGATSKGKQSSPQVGSLTVPINNVDVYVFTDDFDGDGKDDTIYWAYDGSSTYLWTVGSVTCADGTTTDPAGAFVVEIKPDGTGTWLVSTGACPSSDLFGCDFDASGTETTCGVCQIQDGNLVCAVAGQ